MIKGYGTYTKIKHNNKELNIGGILVNNKIFQESESSAWMYRVYPLEYEDSGWRIFSGKESDEYLKIHQIS